MGSPVITSTGARFARVMLLFALVVYGFGFWVNRARALTDFHVLHLGGGLINDGRVDVAYDADSFLAEAANDPFLADRARDLDVFISPPTFALAIRPFALLPSSIALILWTLLGVAAVFGAVRLLRLPWWSALVALIMPFGIAQIYHAQTGFLAMLWVAAIHRLSVDDRHIAAGAIAGLAVLKPTLLLGVAVWWLLDWRRWYPALGAALGVGTTIVAGTLISGFDQWRLFRDAIDAYSLDQDVAFNQPTLAELVNRVAGPEIGSHPMAFVGYLLLAAGAMFYALRHWRDDTAALSGLAVIISVLISPHLLIYDTGLLLVPAAVLVVRGGRWASIERLVMIYVLSSLLTIMSIGPLQTFNDLLTPATIGLLLITGMWIRMINGHCGIPMAAIPTADIVVDGARAQEDHDGQSTLAA